MPDPDAWLGGDGPGPGGREDSSPMQAVPDKNPVPGDPASSKAGAKKRRWSR
jgi:hypothetical protein